MKTLQRALGAMFQQQPVRRGDPYRRAREEGKRLAKQHGIEVEKIDAGMNVWPPRKFTLQDPWDGDHYAQNWSEALPMIRTYAGLEQGPSEASQQDI